MKRSILFVSIPFFFFFSCVSGQSNLTNKEIIKGKTGYHLDSILTPYIQKLRKLTDNEAGLVIGVTNKDEIIYAKTFGFENIETSKKANLNTVFHIASVSKPFTAVAIAKLIQQGKINLSDKLIEHIPEFKMKGNGYEKITIQHILTHTSGIPRHISSGDWENPVVGKNALAYNLKNIVKFELEFEPGSEMSYSNSAFDILGIVVERVSKMRFHEYLIENVLNPAGMNHTFYLKPIDNLPDHWAVPYSYGIDNQKWSPYPYSENYLPSSGVQTTILDMCQWGILHLNQGTYNEFSILDKEHFDLLIQPRYDTPWGDKIALSWYLQSYLGHPNIMHLGNNTGFEAFTCIFPEDDISITIMANRDFSRVGRIMNATSEILFGEKPKDYKVSAKYPFAKKYREQGIDDAIALWEHLKKDSTDIYYTEDIDLRTSAAVLEWDKQYTLAKPLLEYYLEKHEKSSYSWRILGNCHLNLGDTEQAILSYKKALEINPDYTKAIEALEKIKEK